MLTYELSFKGEAGDTLATAFAGLQVECHDGMSTVRGQFPDQAAVHGVLDRMHALGLELLGVRQVVDIPAEQLPDAVPPRPDDAARSAKL